ncbi:hypothetical protein [Methanocella sp. MCL-LM]|uniref:hypothetical protein n=1 Tax=Methanocella sp. MCL-LM TaxID=3412035 RepID=UPI003C778B17
MASPGNRLQKFLEWKSLAIGVIGFILMAIVLFTIFQVGESDRIAFESAPTPVGNGMAPLGYFFFGFFAAMFAGTVVGCLNVLLHPALRGRPEEAFSASLKVFAVTAVLIIISMPLLVPLGTLMLSGTRALSSGIITGYINSAIALAFFMSFLLVPGFFAAGFSGAIISRILQPWKAQA